MQTKVDKLKFVCYILDKRAKMITKTKNLSNKKMNNATYEQRKEVINLIYQAKNLIPYLPRITVRIAENHSEILGVARLNKNTIWITERAVISRAVVFHEIIHAVLGIDHIETCPLMASKIDPNLNNAVCDFLFIKYFNENRKEQK